MVGFQPRHTSEVAQQFSSWDKFHNEIEVSSVLAEALQMNLYEQRTTINGWFSIVRIWLSFCTWSICFDLRISIFFSIFAA